MNILFILFSTNGVNICNIDINENNAFIVNDSLNNKKILVVDSDGDLYLEGENHTTLNYATEKSLYISDYLFFNRVTSKYNNLIVDQLSVPTTNSLIVRNNLGIDVASFRGSDNNIYLKGKAVVEGEQGNCSSDGLYCNGAILENRNYYCDITGNFAGSCTYNVLGSEDCALKSSVDSDGSSSNYDTKGSVTDYTTCGGSSPSSSCLFTTHTDSCSNQTELTEYGTFGNSYVTNSYDCSSRNSNFCNDNDVYKTQNICSTGACSTSTPSFVQSCSASATEYGVWSCKDINTKTQSVTTYSPTCSSGVCDQTSTTSSNDVSCSNGEYCSVGGCLSLSYSWKYGAFGTCSASCGAGTQTRSYWCEDNLGNTVSNTYCSGSPQASQPCNLGACCSPSNICSGGNVVNSCTNAVISNCNGNGCTSGACNTPSCSPSCPSSNSICSDQTYTGSDGCGGNCNVIGTKSCPIAKCGTGSYSCSVGSLDESSIEATPKESYPRGCYLSWDCVSGTSSASCFKTIGCFAPEELVSIPNNEMEISKLKAGDKVISYDEKNNLFVENEIDKVIIHDGINNPVNDFTLYPMINLEIEVNGKNIFTKVTSNHLYYSYNEKRYKFISEFKINESVKSLYGIGKIVSKTKLNQTPVVYNLHMKNEPNNYLVNGIVVHNEKAQACDLCTGSTSCGSATCSPSCSPTTAAATCSGVKFADSCGNSAGCTGTALCCKGVIEPALPSRVSCGTSKHWCGIYATCTSTGWFFTGDVCIADNSECP